MTKLVLFANDKIILDKSNSFLDIDELTDFFLDDIHISKYLADLKSKANLVTLDFNSNNIILQEHDIFKNYYTTLIPEYIFNILLEKYQNNFNFLSIRSALLGLYNNNNQADYIKILVRARQLAAWDNNHQFCGRCGTKTVLLNNEHAKVCQNCNLTSYPRLSPCVLMAVVKDDQILLGRQTHFPDGVYSLLAGFIEAGESAEEAVARETYEETRIKVKNIKYFSSQSWPFPHSLMLAYIADYQSGSVVVDHNELEDARWFSFESLIQCPDLLPANGSLSRMVLNNLLDL